MQVMRITVLELDVAPSAGLELGASNVRIPVFDLMVQLDLSLYSIFVLRFL